MSDTVDGPLAAALSYLRAGLSVVPIRRDGSKAPALRSWKTFQAQLPTEAELRRWFAGPDPPGVAVIGGDVSGGLECLDFDAEAETTFPEWCALAEVESPGLVAWLSVARTPKGGYHVRYRCPDIPIPGNTKLVMDAAKTVLIETRGEGGYALAPGCPAECHETGRLYEHHSGPPLERVQAIGFEERDILIRCARSFDRTPPAESAAKAERSAPLSPGDDFEKRGPDWPAILEPHGWVAFHHRGSVTYWRRPGKEERSWSATTGACTSKAGRSLFYVFSSNAAPFEADRGYSKFATCTFLNYGGDFSAAARALADQGYGEKRGRPSRNGTARHHAAGESDPADDTPAGEDSNGRALPRIDAGNQDLAEVTAQAWEALGGANEPPVLFRHGAHPSRVESDDDDAPMVRPLNVDRMRHRLARVARWEKEVQQGSGKQKQTVIVAASPPLSVVRDVLATPDPPLPILTRIVEVPIFAPDGTLQTTPGYSPASRTFYAPAAGFTMPDIADYPGTIAVEQAKALIRNELISDFPFAGEAERAHAIACLLLPFVRDLIEGPTPLHLIEAPTPGTGKTLLVDLLTSPALGRPVTAMTEGKDEDEWRKRVFAKLRSGPSILLIDNLKRRLESGAVASAITAWPLWEDRLLGVSEIVRVPVRCVWIGTGNNPALSAEMTRRTVRCRLDAKADRPWLRDGFRHPDIRRWTKDNRGALVAAALTLVRAWLVAGRPEGARTLGMFENWARTLGGILDVAGVPGFLANLNEFYERADTDTAIWSAFIGSWWDARGSSEAKAGDLWSLAIEAGVELGDKNEASQKTRLGRLLREMCDRVFSIGELRLRLERAGKAQRAQLWRLQRAD